MPHRWFQTKAALFFRSLSLSRFVYIFLVCGELYVRAKNLRTESQIRLNNHSHVLTTTELNKNCKKKNKSNAKQFHVIHTHVALLALLIG